MSEIDLTKLGGSDAPAILGISPWKSQIDIFARVVQGVRAPTTPAMERGTELEPYVRKLYLKETGFKLWGPQSPQIHGRPWMRANLDDVADTDSGARVVELKTAHWRQAYLWEDDEVPPDYLVQAQFYMWACNMATADLAVLLSVDDFRIKTVQADAELQAMIVEAMERFHRNHIVTGKPPPPDGSESYADFLKQKFPSHHAPLLKATANVDLLAQNYRQACDELDQKSEEVMAMKNELKAIIGEAEGIEGVGWKITWKNTKDSLSTDWEALAMSLNPTVSQVAAFRKEKGGHRTFRPYWRKEK